MKKKILVVDDTTAIVEVLDCFLRSHGFNVKGAYGGDEGLALAQDFLPDIILLDVLMPPGIEGGYEACRKLKQDDRLKEIPVMFVTSKKDPEDVRFGYSLGAVDYVFKPFDLSDLHKKITFVLENNNGHKRKDS